MDIKNILKFLKLNEPTISTILGALVVIFAALLIINQFKKGIGKKPEVTPVAQKETATENITPSPQGEIPKNLPDNYTVKKGDNLWRIAENYYGSGYNWVDIAQANQLTDPDVLVVGQKLKLPKVPAKKTTVANNKTPAKNQTGNQNAISGDTYTVVHGDNLWTIAIRAYGDGYQWIKIAKANKLANPNLIHAGNVFKIPREDTVK